jgi:Tfp pilus assembly protein FimT
MVAGIVTILSAIAVPRYANSLSNYRATIAARRLMADIQLAQSRARAMSTSQAVTFSVAQNTYQLTGYADPDRPTSTYTASLKDAGLSATLVSASFGGGSTLTFSGYGVPSASGTVVLRSGQAQRTVRVSADTGTVSVQ